jgi:RNA polymerase primary sigma factor
MDGKPRREALNALDALDLTLSFMREIARVLTLDASTKREGTVIDNLITVHEAATQKLIISHLPYVRRFSSRNVESNEDPEDVFQVAFIGLQSATRRFDPERSVRFMIYSAFWMRQAISRWRADEGTQVRVPVHRFEKLAKLDAMIDKRDIRSDRGVSDAELAEGVDVSLDEVKLLRSIPRIPIDLQCGDWDSLFPVQEIEDSIESLETQKIVRDVLEGLNDRQAAIIKMRFGIGQDSEMTLEEIGQMYGVTRERIRQIEAKALEYLSHPARKSRLKMLLGL